MSFSISFHLSSGSRGHWGCDYYMYTCMNPDLAGFKVLARNLHFWGSERAQDVVVGPPFLQLT